MKKLIIGVLAGLIVSPIVPLASAQKFTGVVDVHVACQRERQLNCTWYGKFYKPGDGPATSAGAYWINMAQDDGTYCQFRLVPVRGLYCADYWPFKWWLVDN